jgi:hypothetical protein
MSGESLLLNFDMTLFYEKRVQDYLDAQRDNGELSGPVSVSSHRL